MTDSTSSLENLLNNISTSGKHLVKDLGPLKTQVTNSADPAKPNPFDNSALRLPDPTWELAQSIISSCHELITLLTPTRIKLLDDACAVAISAALGIASNLKIADTIEELGGGSGGVSTKELALNVKAGETKLASVLRALTGVGIFVEEEDGKFYNNRLSNGMNTSRIVGGKEMLEMYSLFLGKAAINGLLPVMKDPKRMDSIASTDAAFGEAYNTPLDSIEFCMQPGNGEYLGKLMTGFPWLTDIMSEETVQNFDWLKWGAEAKICDMGCGDGGMMVAVKEKEKTLRIVCQELEQVFPITTQNFENRLPGAIAGGSVEIQIHDYFTPQHVQADVYWLRGVLHDYSDKDCLRILANLKPCLEANPDASVLINEIAVPHIASNGSRKEHSSFPRFITTMQLQTTSFLPGSERTYAQWGDLFACAGYEIRQFYPLRVFTSIFEIGLKR